MNNTSKNVPRGSELDAFLKMLARAGASITLTVADAESDFPPSVENATYKVEVANKVIGYNGFVSCWYWDAKGLLMATGAYE